MSDTDPLATETVAPVQEAEEIKPEDPAVIETTDNPVVDVPSLNSRSASPTPAAASSVDAPRSPSPSPSPSPSLAIASPGRADSTASSVSSNPRAAAASPTSQRISSALCAHGEILNWPEDWNRVEEKMNEANHKYVISVLSPEVVSSMMTK